MDNLLFIRLFFILLLGCVAWYLQPFELPGYLAALVGSVIGVAIVFFEIQVR